MYFLELYSGEIGIFSAILFVCSIMIFFKLDENDKNGKSNKMSTAFASIALCSFISFIVFVSVFFWAADNYDSVISARPVNVLKVQNLSPNGTDVTFSVDGVLKEDNYTDPIKLSSSIQKPSAEIELRKSIFGDQKSFLSNLIVPESYVH